MGLTSRKPFGGPKRLQVAKVASLLGNPGAYKSQALWLTSRKSRKTRGLQVAELVSSLGDQGAYKYHS